jgi:hypothetical protein
MLLFYLVPEEMQYNKEKDIVRFLMAIRIIWIGHVERMEDKK